MRRKLHSQRPPTARELRGMTLAEIALVCGRDRGLRDVDAIPPLAAMRALQDIVGWYHAESGYRVVALFLEHTRGWRGPTARAVKVELRRRMRHYTLACHDPRYRESHGTKSTH